jgi:hypothetical protein
MRLIRKPEWWDKRGQWMKRYLKKEIKTITFSKGNEYYQFKTTKYIIQAFNDSILFICLERYYGKDAYDCFSQGLIDFLICYEDLEKKLHYKFFLDDAPQVSIRSQNYNFLKDALAKKCKKNGEQFEVLIDGKRVLWVDFSEPLGVESDNPESMEHYKGYIVDIMKNRPPHLSVLKDAIEETNNSVNLFVRKWDYYAKNIETHVGAMKDLRIGINDLIDVIRDIKKKDS